MTKADIVNEITKNTGIDKVTVLATVEAFMDAVKASFPVNVAYVVAKLILAHLGECHTSTLEGRVILPGKDIVGQSARLYLNLTDFLQKFCCFH